MNKEHDILLKKATLIKIAIDMQIDQSRPQPAQKFYAPGLLPLAGEAASSGRSGGGLLRGGLLWV
jgi:hypothetical protein